MTEAGSDECNVLRFPLEQRRPSVELAAPLAPMRSLVDTLIAERDEAPHDALAGFAREFAYQARAFEAGYGRDEAIVRLRGLMDAHLGNAVGICRAYQEAADRMVGKEVAAARADRILGQTRRALEAARAEVRGRAIAVRVTAMPHWARRRRWPPISARG